MKQFRSQAQMLDKLFCDCNGDHINIDIQPASGSNQIQLDDPNNILAPVRLDCDSLDAMLLEGNNEEVEKDGEEEDKECQAVTSLNGGSGEQTSEEKKSHTNDDSVKQQLFHSEGQLSPKHNVQE